MGIPQVGFSHTIPIPLNTITTTGMGTNQTVNHTVLYETCGIIQNPQCNAEPAGVLGF